MLLNLLLSVGLLAFARADDAAPKLGDCAPKPCGSGFNISFPFWISGIHKSYCGHPLFAITCNDRRPLFGISGENYSVSGISYSNSTFNLSRASPLPTNSGSCFLPPERFNLVDTFFQPSDGWIYFSSCTKDLPNGNHNINCTRDGRNGSYYIGTERGGLNQSCNPFEKYPAPIGWRLNHSRYENFVNQMFRLNWKGFNCSDCTTSGGECGYNVSKPAVICICSDRIHAVSCVNTARGSLLNRKETIIIWVSSMAGIFLLSYFLYLCLRHVKRNSTSFLGTFLRKISKDNTMGRELHLLENHFQTHIFSYKQLEEATDCFADANEIGDGGFGTVYKGKLRDGRIVAVKRLYESSYKRMDQFVNEVSIFNHIRHKNLISFYGCTNFYSRGLLLVYEYMSNGTVADHLYGSRTDQPLTWTMRMTIAMETAEVLAYLHATKPPIIHRDIKTSNILLDDHYHVKVADFGLSRLFPPDASYVSTVPQGTPGYLDPEYHRDYRLTDKSDVYSFGVVLAELISSKPAVDISRDISEINLADMTINKIQRNLLHELVDQAFGFETEREVRKMVEEVAMLAIRCLQTEKASRPSMEEVFQALKASNRDQECSKAIKSDQNTSEDARLLCPVQNSPDTVHAAWVSPSTTPNTSG